MGYIFDGALLAACIGAYRVYTDRRKSALHTNWDLYRYFWVNVSRHSGDFVASTCFDLVCHYPSESRSVFDKAIEVIPATESAIDTFKRWMVDRSGRFGVWSRYGHLGYLQRVAQLDRSTASTFHACRSWKSNLVFTSPHLLSYVKDDPTRSYLHTLCCVRDGMVGVVEGSPSQISQLLSSIQASKRDIVQDIRKGHVLDRKTESSVRIIHELRMGIEDFLFGATGPDPDRATYIEKAIFDKSGGVLERLFPYLEVIVDNSGESLTSHGELHLLAPNIDVYVPHLKLGEEAVGVGIGDGEFILNPLLVDLSFDGRALPEDIAEGSVGVISVGGSETRKVKIMGRHGQAVKVKVVS